MAAAIFGSKRLYLDHLAPLAALLQIPLIVTESEIYQLTKKYYPDIDVLLYEGLAATTAIVADYEILITTLPCTLLKRMLFFACQALKKEPKMIWIPHGNSDKGRKKPLMEGLGSEETILVYGQKMMDFIEEKGVLEQIPHVHQLGNYRYTYYLKHKDFYRELTQKYRSYQKTILYAPTWEDFESSGTLFNLGREALKKLGSSHQILIKLHPNTVREKTAELLQLKTEFPTATFIEEFPPIYPLCDLADIYLGDMSSIGYDFLTFQKPLFFLNPHNDDPEKLGLSLHQCGYTISPDQIEELPHLIEKKQEELSDQKQKLYSHTFAKTFDPENLTAVILNTWDKNLSHSQSTPEEI
ncbi:MAG: CDP-glycerol glycerophosphotransferase family protein [Candidatus Algichlamydia australiensis]|nr:CDP-glycerol glycerophosphotransferase family protein [Chlamydiales bacterium]